MIFMLRIPSYTASRLWSRFAAYEEFRSLARGERGMGEGYSLAVTGASAISVHSFLLSLKIRDYLQSVFGLQ